MDALYEAAGYFFDLDGVIWVGKNPVPGAVRTIDTLRKRQKRVKFVSNTSSRSHAEVLAKLHRMGFDVEAEDLVVASAATAEYLSERHPGAKVYVIGSQGLFDELKRSGIEARPAVDQRPRPVDYVVIGKADEFDYLRLTCVLRALRMGAKLIAVNEDMIVPHHEGPIPGAGATVAAVTAMTGRPVDVIIGKPGTLLLETALKGIGAAPASCVMVGDTVETDIAAGKNLGLKTALVLTGNANGAGLPDDLRPDWILNSVVDVVRD